MSERKWLARILFLETVAGVPGMVSGGRASGRAGLGGELSEWLIGWWAGQASE